MFKFNFGGQPETSDDLVQQAVHSEAHFTAASSGADERPDVSTVTVDFELNGTSAEVHLCKASPDDRWCRELLIADEGEAVSTSDLVPGKYEGGFKVWEGALDLLVVLGATVASIQRPARLEAAAESQIPAQAVSARPSNANAGASDEPSSAAQNGHSNLTAGLRQVHGKRVLELGCGHGLPGIFMLLGGASVTFHDFNEAVLDKAAAVNVAANIETFSCSSCAQRCRYVCGDFESTCTLLAAQNPSQPFDYILTSESIYNVFSARQLLAGCAKCLSEDGEVYVASKSHYFGVGGGLSHFKELLAEQGIFSCSVVTRIDDGASNVREVLKLQRL